MEKVAATKMAMAAGFTGGMPGSPPPGPPGPGGAPPMPGGGPPGLPPEVMPNAAMGVPPVPPQGPPMTMPAGSPRPGAVDNEEARMRQMGLVPPREV